MPTPNQCSECGTELTTREEGGLCQRCLLNLGLDALPESDGSSELDIAVERAGATIGRYKLLEKIGEGGFGVVFMAEQVEPVRRQVALKIIKAGMDTREVVARFEAERQALALMDHPNIARVLDAGATQAGRPFFVMELVRGISITSYCDQRNLGTPERLSLFIQICKAVQHAHQKGIIHRDLKPSNILVTHQDSEALPKVIDFGVAKALGQKLTDKTLFTGFLRMVGTPAYMSPEQAELTGMDIDTRSDVYSLGVLLYELLTGVTPFDAETFRKAAFDEVRRMIRETEPPKPSTRLQTLGERLAEVARHRQTEPPKLIHSVRGDLDWIVMKCLEKDRNRRYETANGLARDIERHLQSEPVTARSPTNLYRFQKLVRRNKLAFGAGLAIAFSLLIGLAASVWQAARATRAKDRAVLAEAAQEQSARKAEHDRDLAQAATHRAEQQKQRADEQAEANRLNLYASDILATQSALNQLNFGIARQLLNRHRPEAGQKDLRGFEWRLLWQRSRGDQLHTLQNHSDAVTCVAFSPDGKYLLSGSYDQTITVWEVESGRKVNAWRAHEAGLSSLSIAPDGKQLATGATDGTIKLWAWPDAALQFEFKKLGGYAKFDSTTPRLFTGRGSFAKKADNTEGVAQYVLTSSNAPEQVAQFKAPSMGFVVPSPVRNLVAVGGCGDVQLMDLSGRAVRSVEESKEALSIAFSPDARLLAVCSGPACSGPSCSGPSATQPENEIRIHDVATGQRLTRLTNHTGRVWSLDFSPDGQWLVSASSDQTVRLWGVATWQEINRFTGHRSEVWSVAFSPDGKLLASGGRDNAVLIWKAEPAVETRRLEGALVHYGDNLPPTFLVKESLFAATIADRGRSHVGIWSVDTGKLLHEFAAEKICVGEDAEGTAILTLSWGKPMVFLRSWHPRDFHLLREVASPSEIRSFRMAWLCADRRSVLISQSGRAIEVDCETGQIRTEIPLPDMKQPSARLSPDRSGWAAVELQGNFGRTGPTARSSDVAELAGHRAGIFAVVFSPVENILATASIDNTAALWEWPSGRRLEILQGHKEGLFWCDFSPDGKTLATASGDRTVKLWHVATRREVMTLDHKLPVMVCVFSPEGNYLATGTTDGAYHFWRAATGEEVAAAEEVSATGKQ